MGLAAEQIDRMTVAQMVAQYRGFKTFHGGKAAVEIDQDDFQRVLAEEMAAGRA